jgi:hypothetical protein
MIDDCFPWCKHLFLKILRIDLRCRAAGTHRCTCYDPPYITIKLRRHPTTNCKYSVHVSRYMSTPLITDEHALNQLITHKDIIQRHFNGEKDLHINFICATWGCLRVSKEDIYDCVQKHVYYEFDHRRTGQPLIRINFGTHCTSFNACRWGSFMSQVDFMHQFMQLILDDYFIQNQDGYVNDLIANSYFHVPADVDRGRQPASLKTICSMNIMKMHNDEERRVNRAFNLAFTDDRLNSWCLCEISRQT